MFPDSLPDNKIKIYNSTSVFDNENEMIRAFIMEDYSIGMHCQEFYEINIVLSGRGCHYINNGKIIVKEGDTFIIPPGSMHGYSGGNEFDVFHLLISNEFFNKYIGDFCKLPSFFTLFDIEPTLRARSDFVPSLILKDNDFSEIKSLTDHLVSYNGKHDKINYLLLSSYSVILIVMLCNIYSENITIAPKESSFIDSLSLIYQRYNEKITINRLADTAHMSRSAYIKKFKEIFKASPIDFLISRRITVAKELLATTGYPTDKIAELTGFHDASHLIRFFIRHELITPAEFRKKEKEKEI